MGAPRGNKNAAGRHRKAGHSKAYEKREKKRVSSLKSALVKRYGTASVSKMFSNTYKSNKQKKRFTW